MCLFLSMFHLLLDVTGRITFEIMEIGRNAFGSQESVNIFCKISCNRTQKLDMQVLPCLQENLF